MDERRELPRFDINKEAKVWIKESQSFNHCLIEDLHLKGMKVSFARQLFKEQLEHISLTLGENFDLIEIEATVPWSSEEDGRYVYGLAFTKVAEHDKDRIYQYISRTCSSQYRHNWYGD